MNSIHSLDRVFPLAGVSADRAPLRAPRLAWAVNVGPVPTVMGNHAFLRAWAARRAKMAVPSAPPK